VREGRIFNLSNQRCNDISEVGIRNEEQIEWQRTCRQMRCKKRRYQKLTQAALLGIVAGCVSQSRRSTRNHRRWRLTTNEMCSGQNVNGGMIHCDVRMSGIGRLCDFPKAKTIVLYKPTKS
jgi:hypothetical protein